MLNPTTKTKQLIYAIFFFNAFKLLILYQSFDNEETWRLNVNRTFKMAASGRTNVQRTWKNERSLSNLDVQESTHLPGLRQKGPGDMGNQRFIGIHEAAKRRGWTHTWLRSNQPLSSVLTPFSVPPSPSNSSYPVQLLLLCPPSFKDPLHLVVNGPLWVPSFSHAVIPLCFSSPLH